ncbi:MAG: pilus assembly protein PilM, partial [Deltaproteobacteria bacterium]|nr:pilus assembly protein PilM [Deltaproteobacteria bacterium]
MPTAIGINLGTQEIRVALFRGTPGRLRVASFHERTLPPQENRQAWLAALGPALQSLGREVRAGTAPIVVALPAQLAVLRTLTVPFARLADIDRVVKPQMEPFLAGPIEEVVVEYEVLKQSEIGSDLFVAAVPKADLRKILSALEAARLEPETVTLDIFGLAHLVGQTDTAAALENRLILDLGAGASKAVFLRQGKLFSARAFRASGLAATALIQQELGLSLEAAEAMKVDATDLAAISSLQLKSALTESYGRIAREVKMFLASLGEGGVDGVFLTGGGTRLKGISPLLALEGANVQIRPLALPAGTGLPPRLAPDAEKAATLLA